MLDIYFKSLLVPSIHYGPNPYKKISKLYMTHAQFLNVDFPAADSFSIMLVDGGFFWLICQCLFLNAPTMYYYHVGGNNITNLSLSTLGFLLWGTRGARVRGGWARGSSLRNCAALSGRGGCPRQPTTTTPDKPAPLLTEEGWELLANCHH